MKKAKYVHDKLPSIGAEVKITRIPIDSAWASCFYNSNHSLYNRIHRTFIHTKRGTFIPLNPIWDGDHVYLGFYGVGHSFKIIN